MNKQECKKYFKKAYKKIIEQNKNLNTKNIEFEMKNVAKVIDHIRQTRYNKQEETAEDTPQDARPAVNLISEEISL